MQKPNYQTPEVVNRNGTLYLRVSQPKPKTSRLQLWTIASVTVLSIGLSMVYFKSMPPRFLPNGTVLQQSEPRGDGKLAIDNGTEQDAVVKLVKLGNEQAIASVYIRSKSKAELARIPDGSYEFFVTQGSDWDSATAKFTRSPSYSKFDLVADFITITVERGGFPILENSIWQISLHPVPLGNTRTEKVSESDFARYQ